MKVELKERVEVHKKLYKDLCLWLDAMNENEIRFLFMLKEFRYREWLNSDEPSIIEGANVTLVMKGGFSSKEMEYLVMILGARSYKVTAYPLSQIHIDLKVPIANTNKAIMTCAGKWTPYWKKDEQEQE